MSRYGQTKVSLKRVANLYNGNSIRDEEKSLYRDPSDAIPYIATKDLTSEGSQIDYDNGMYVKQDDKTFARAHAGDTLICLEGGSAGRKLALLDKDVAFVNKLCCLHPLNIEPLFLYYAVQTQDFKDDFFSSMTGLIGGVSVSALGCIGIPFPKREEQVRIASYLFQRTKKIDRLIQLCERAIQLDEEHIRTVISRVVTKGLDSDASFRDSGIPRIGSIPKTWSRSRIGWIRRRPTAYGIIKLGDEPAESGIPVLRCSDVKNGYIDITNVRTVARELSDEYSRTILSGGEVVINVRGTLGGCAVVPDTCAGWNIAREVAMIDVSPDYDSRFIQYYLMSESFWSYLNSNLAGSVYQGLNIEMLEHAEVVLPPLNEQREIADYLDEKFARYRQLVHLKQQLLSLLREYRTALITEAVTGKIKVPGV